MGPAYHDYQVMGLQIQTTCVVAIIVLSFIGTFMIDFLGPRFLQTDVAPAATTTSADLEQKPEQNEDAVLTESENHYSGGFSGPAIEEEKLQEHVHQHADSSENHGHEEEDHIQDIHAIQTVGVVTKKDD